jgi:helix-turn-helix protein
VPGAELFPRSTRRAVGCIAAATFSGITEKTLRKAIKEGRLPYTVDTSPGAWPKTGRYLIRQADVDEFKLNRYDPYFKKGRWLRTNDERTSTIGSVVAFAGTDSRGADKA